jgi:hypothetical protein
MILVLALPRDKLHNPIFDHVLITIVAAPCIDIADARRWIIAEAREPTAADGAFETIRIGIELITNNY